MKLPVGPDDVYRNVPLDGIPWNIETPLEPPVQLIERGRIAPCRSIDHGCVAGNDAVYLAESALCGNRPFETAWVKDRAALRGPDGRNPVSGPDPH